MQTHTNTPKDRWTQTQPDTHKHRQTDTTTDRQTQTRTIPVISLYIGRILFETRPIRLQHTVVRMHWVAEVISLLGV